MYLKLYKGMKQALRWCKTCWYENNTVVNICPSTQCFSCKLFSMTSSTQWKALCMFDSEGHIQQLCVTFVVHNLGGPSTVDFSILIQILKKTIYSPCSSNKIIATKFCTWHDSCAVMVSANICSDWNYRKKDYSPNLIHIFFLIVNGPLIWTAK